MKTFNLGWGNSIAVRDAFLGELHPGKAIRFDMDALDAMDYPPHEGNAELIEITKDVIERQTGRRFIHVVLTNGATGACTLAMRAYQQRGYNTVFTPTPPYFPIYPAMFKSVGLKPKTGGMIVSESDKLIALIDSPTNPKGVIIRSLGSFTAPVIWDAVYNNRVYTEGKHAPLPCDVVAGSYSKLLGLNGLRTGWVATDDPLLYERIKELATAEYCGLSTASTTILLSLLKDLNWDEFERQARFSLYRNREEWSKLEKYFSDEPTPENGMFYYGFIDSACRKLLEKSGIVWTTGSSCGHDDHFGRFNLGQSEEVVRQAVKTIKKNDKI